MMMEGDEEKSSVGSVGSVVVVVVSSPVAACLSDPSDSVGLVSGSIDRSIGSTSSWARYCTVAWRR